MISLNLREADRPAQTRSFAQAADQRSSNSQHEPHCSQYMSMFAQAVEESSLPPRTVPSKRRSMSVSRSNMPVPANSPSLPVSFPSFMSVFGAGPGSREGREEKKGESFTTERPSQTPKLQPSESQLGSISFQHRESVSSASESTDSSPTTTISTFDSPSAMDTSPSSSPESPTSIAPLLKTMTPHNINNNNNNNNTQDDELRDTFPTSSQPLNGPRRSDSPNRRARNLKNLTLNMPAPSSSRPSISTASVVETSHHLSAPSSPVKPPLKTARRRPANLTIRTPCLDRSLSNNIAEIGPQSAHPKPTLRHIESSPSLPSLFSPTTAPAGGMQLPRPVTSSGNSTIPESSWEDLNSTQTGGRNHILSSQEALPELKEEDDPPISRESQKGEERGYPDGPIRIYDSGVYLYLEPTRDEASKFDVVFNVAKEVTNPFTKSAPKNNTIMSVWRNAPVESKRSSVVEPQTAVSEVSFKSAFEYLPGEAESPTTPKAEVSEPEYIHVPWDHNSEILDDLHRLCETIDDRISKGKSVLIHCQLGVSRSASLVIAYGLYKNRDMDFNSMYGVVKERSSWVGPNMSLIYQLTDFRSKLQQGCFSQPAPELGFEPESPADNEGPESEPAMSIKVPKCGATGESGSNKQTRRYFSHHLPPIPKFDSPRSNHRPLATSRSSSALNSKTSRTAQRRNVSPRPLPLREKYHPIPPPSSLQQQQERTVSQPVPSKDLIMEEAPETPSFFSPRVAGFVAAPFSRTAAGDLHGTSEDPMSPVGCGSNMEDPRSPPQRTESFIMRNIDEFL